MEDGDRFGRCDEVPVAAHKSAFSIPRLSKIYCVALALAHLAASWDAPSQPTNHHLPGIVVSSSRDGLMTDLTYGGSGLEKPVDHLVV